MTRKEPMSSILKALKKLEKENAARRQEPVRIDAGILGADPKSRMSPVGMVLASIILFLCGSILTYALLERNRQRQAAPPGYAPRQMASPENQGIGPKRAAPSATGETENVAHRPYSLEPGLPHPAREPLPSGIKRQKLRTAATDRPAPGNGGPPGPAAPTPLAPVLRVDGIAFQEGVDGVAVVNGVQVTRGTSIEGVRVDEVQRDRVLFSHDGKRIEVYLGRSNR